MGRFKPIRSLRFSRKVKAAFSEDRMTQQTENISEEKAYSPVSTTKGKVIKIILVVVFVVILVGVIRVVRYTKHNLPPSTALLPVPAETLERQKGE
jgi:hypothetical protein